jgi:hypothetical protein
MDADVVLGVLKITSVLIAAILGVTGLLTDFRDRYGRLSRPGQLVLVGMIVSAGVGVVTSGIESLKARSASQEQAARTEALLRELSRSIQPIKSLSVTYSLEVPQTSERVKKYVARLEAGIAKHLPELADMRAPAIPGLQTTTGTLTGGVGIVEVGEESEFWPTADEVRLIPPKKFFSLSLDFFKKPVNPKEYYPVHGRSDFGAFALVSTHVNYNWDLERRQLSIWGHIEFDKKFWKSNGKIASVLDIRGSQILIFPPATESLAHIPALKDFPEDKQALQLARELKPLWFNFDFGDGHSFAVRGKHFEVVETRYGRIAYSLVIPEKAEDFAKLTTGLDD